MYHHLEKLCEKGSTWQKPLAEKGFGLVWYIRCLVERPNPVLERRLGFLTLRQLYTRQLFGEEERRRCLHSRFCIFLRGIWIKDSVSATTIVHNGNNEHQTQRPLVVLLAFC